MLQVLKEVWKEEEEPSAVLRHEAVVVGVVAVADKKGTVDSVDAFLKMPYGLRSLRKVEPTKAFGQQTRLLADESKTQVLATLPLVLQAVPGVRLHTKVS